MMWCTKSIGLVALLVSGLCNAGELEREESNVRVDAEKDPFESLMIDDGNGPTSKLFGKCLDDAAGGTLEAKLYSIEIPSATTINVTRAMSLSRTPVIEYVRHVPDSYELLVPADWKSITTNAVPSIFECFTAAYTNGYPMFKYNGVNDCKVSNRTYDLAYEPACETEDQEAVFISSNATSSSCPLPAVMLNINVTSGTYTCIFFTTDLMNMTEADAWCADKNSVVFSVSQKISYMEIVQVLNGLNVTTHDFFTKAERNSTGTWIWPQLAIAVDPALMVRNSTSADDVMYIKGSAGFKYDFGQLSSFKAGVVCI